MCWRFSSTALLSRTAIPTIQPHSSRLTRFAPYATAATAIIRPLHSCDETFSIRRAPYLISYAAYVAATIIVRIADQEEEDSQAHAGLRTSMFNDNQETNWVVRCAKNVITHMMKQMSVSLDRTHSSLEGAYTGRQTTISFTV